MIRALNIIKRAIEEGNFDICPEMTISEASELAREWILDNIPCDLEAKCEEDENGFLCYDDGAGIEYSAKEGTRIVDSEGRVIKLLKV